MSLKKLSLLVIIFLLVFPLEGQNIEEKSTYEFINPSLYDKWYEEQPNWSLNNFPGNKKSYNGSQYSWGWSYVANSLIDMYEATKDEKYIRLLIPQIEYILTQTDEKLGIESFTDSGLSLPAWSDDGYYTSGKYNYVYPVHTGMIVLPILRLVNVIKENKLEEYREVANKFLIASGDALAIHNSDIMWKNFSESEGFYMGHPYGEGIVSEASRIALPNRIFIYLAACGLYDKLTNGSVYTERIEKSLRYFKNSLLKYDKDYDAYYWSYWKEVNPKRWEDISHASLTVYGIFILYEEVGFTVFTKKDILKFGNIIYKVIDNRFSPKVSKNIHRNNNEKKRYYSLEENIYYFSVLRWSFLGIYDKDILDSLNGIYIKLYNQDLSSSTELFSIAMFIKANKKYKFSE